MNNLLSQRNEIKRLEVEMEKEKVDLADQDARDEEAARERAVQEFELVQQGLNVSGKARKVGGVEEDGERDLKRGSKRKFELDEEELLRIAKEERTKYKKELDDEKVCL